MSLMLEDHVGYPCFLCHPLPLVVLAQDSLNGNHAPTSLPQGWLLFPQRASQHTRHSHHHTSVAGRHAIPLPGRKGCKDDEYMQCVEQPCLGTFLSCCYCHFPSWRGHRALHPAAADTDCIFRLFHPREHLGVKYVKLGWLLLSFEPKGNK